MFYCSPNIMNIRADLYLKYRSPLHHLSQSPVSSLFSLAALVSSLSHASTSSSPPSTLCSLSFPILRPLCVNWDLFLTNHIEIWFCVVHEVVRISICEWRWTEYERSSGQETSHLQPSSWSIKSISWCILELYCSVRIFLFLRLNKKSLVWRNSIKGCTRPSPLP